MHTATSVADATPARGGGGEGASAAHAASAERSPRSRIAAPPAARQRIPGARKFSSKRRTCVLISQDGLGGNNKFSLINSDAFRTSADTRGRILDTRGQTDAKRPGHSRTLADAFWTMGLYESDRRRRRAQRRVATPRHGDVRRRRGLLPDQRHHSPLPRARRGDRARGVRGGLCGHGAIAVSPLDRCPRVQGPRPPRSLRSALQQPRAHPEGSLVGGRVVGRRRGWRAAAVCDAESTSCSPRSSSSTQTSMPRRGATHDSRGCRATSLSRVVDSVAQTHPH
jgi:hypothetical protein